MAKFDISKYWEFRVWVKSQIEQLRKLVSEYQPGSGGGGDSNFNPNGSYPNMSVGKATTATTLASAPAISASGNGIAITAGGKTSSTLSLKTINGASIIGSGDIDTGGDFDPDGTYPNMSVGTATDLSGRNEASPAVFTYRPSAGDKSIKDDNAFIRRVKGNSIAWNQYATRIARSSGITFTYSNGVYELSGTTTGTYFNTANPANFVSGHKILLILDIVANPNNISFKYGDLNANAQFDINTTNHIIYTTPTTRSYNLGIVSFGGVGVDFSGVKIRQMWVDLTAMFGTGNEPTTVEEFRALYPNSYYPYNAGELRNLVCSGIKTVGFNEFNGAYARVLPNESYYLGGSYTSIGFATEIGGATESISIPSNRIYTPTQLGYIYATGTDICINLHHTGYRDGEYEPYKEVTHTLPLSQITNGEPLRKAGGEVYDEINETEYIRRVGVRGYATGDKDDATLLTDGIYTNYPLDEPIVKPIETPIDFNYYVEDFGTEEAILAENSAPFSADIVYAFNATDNIRDNERNIQRLNKKVSELATAKNIGTKPLRFLALNEAVEPFTFTVFEYEFILYDDSNDYDGYITIMLTPPDSNIGIEEITHIVEYEFTFTTAGEVNSYLNIAGAHWGEISNEIEPNMRYIIKVITFDGSDYFITNKKTYAREEYN
ncbi:MAG: hypothetical protein IIV72_08270 [Alistipes sp.]|nr:hypothetical protein [Alistipes sp.]